MHPADLEPLIGKALQQLPPPRAPHTLVPRVMAAVQQWTLRPWYAREWLTWPAALQVGSIAALIALLSGTAAVWPYAAVALESAADSSEAAAILQGVAGVVATTTAAANALAVVFRSVLEPIASYVIALLMLTCLACVLLVTTLSRVTLGRVLPL